jgi:hypothetical protein
MRRARKEAAMKSATDAQPVLTLAETRDLLRAASDEGARNWVKQYAPQAILPGGRFRVSRALLLKVIEGGAQTEIGGAR